MSSNAPNVPPVDLGSARSKTSETFKKMGESLKKSFTPRSSKSTTPAGSSRATTPFSAKAREAKDAAVKSTKDAAAAAKAGAQRAANATADAARSARNTVDKAVRDEKNKPGFLASVVALAVAVGAGLWVKEQRKPGGKLAKA